MPIGMFHCPQCGEMVIAWTEHPHQALNAAGGEDRL